MTSSWIWIGAALLGLLSLAHSKTDCKLPNNTCPAMEGDAEAMEDIDGMFAVDKSEFPIDLDLGTSEFIVCNKKHVYMRGVEGMHVNGKIHVDIMCKYHLPFDSQEELERDLAESATMKAMYYENLDINTEINSDRTAALTYPHHDWHWGPVCPHISYHVWLWGLHHGKYGICYVMSHFHATRCTTRHCRFITHWTDDLFYHYRCVQHYRRVYFWLWCPMMISDNVHKHFVPYSRLIPSCCECHRYMCRPHVELPGDATKG